MIPRTHLIVMLLLAAAAAGFGAFMYPQLPDPSPTHWNIRGEADGFGPPWEAAFAVPAIGVGLIVVLSLLPLLGPFRENFDRFRVTYGRLSVTIMACIMAMHVVFVLKASGRPMPLGAALATIVGLIVAVIGNWMGKLRRNFYIGIRTPWTIANEAVWEKTHRAGGRIMVLIGSGAAATGLLGAADVVCFWVLIGGLITLVAWSFAYSLYWYRRLGQVDDLPASAPSQAE